MSDDRQKFQRALAETRLIRAPRRKIETFWTTELPYFIVSVQHNQENGLPGPLTVARQGLMVCARPRILSPGGMRNHFQGFSEEARQFADFFSRQENFDLNQLRVLGYQFRNDLQSEETHQLDEQQLISNIIARNAERSDYALVFAPEPVWPLSLVKIMLEAVFRSYRMNVEDLEERGMFAAAKPEGEAEDGETQRLFAAARANPAADSIAALAGHLRSQGLFARYEDEFLDLVKAAGADPEPEA